VLRFGSPTVLAAVGVLALVPLLLHLIARRPSNRSALPTARFLPHDAHLRPRLQRRPTDVPLLLLRMLFVLLVAAAFARPVWVPARTGTAELVLLDAGTGMAPAWESAIATARARLVGGGGLLVFDTAFHVATTERGAFALLDSLAAAGPSAVESEYAQGMRGIHALAAALPASDSMRAVLLTLPRWEAWSAGLSEVRRAAWPGRMAVVALDQADGMNRTNAADGVGEAAGAGGPGGAVPADRADGSDSPVGAAVEPPGRGAVVLAPAGEGAFVTAALGALGWEVARPDRAEDVPGGSLYVVTAALTAAVEAALLERARAGATVVLAGVVPSGALAAVLPWVGGTFAADGGVPGGDLLVGITRLPGAATRAGGGPAEGARVVAAWDDGHAAAAAHSLDSGCVVFLSTHLERGALPLSPEFPAALARLADGCATMSAPAAAGWQASAGPLDAGARAILEAPADDEWVAMEALRRGGEGIPLYRWIVAAALLAALLETRVTYGNRGRFERAA
jgi:hypothetical protein